MHDNLLPGMVLKYMYDMPSPSIQDLPDSLDDLLLPLSQDTAADMFVLGTQESTPLR